MDAGINLAKVEAPQLLLIPEALAKAQINLVCHSLAWLDIGSIVRFVSHYYASHFISFSVHCSRMTIN